MSLITYTAADHGTATAHAVLTGACTPELAGDNWLAWANKSHEAGEAFLAAYDTAGGLR